MSIAIGVSTDPFLNTLFKSLLSVDNNLVLVSRVQKYLSANRYNIGLFLKSGWYMTAAMLELLSQMSKPYLMKKQFS